ncbi:MAG: hypothetical protein DSY89_01230 [Deltaproteobacteria bacterium]|nr:MAG: hypothetical protein DSY89_01230 [Deltaproteobacteria bacterium]
MPEKIFLTPDQLINDSFILAKKIYDSGFEPEIIIVLWRGGTPVGMAVHEFLLYKGVKSYHTVIKTESYTGIGTRAEVRVEHIDALLSTVPNNSKVLVIDDIFDSGKTKTATKILPACDFVDYFLSPAPKNSGALHFKGLAKSIIELNIIHLLFNHVKPD